MSQLDSWHPKCHRPILLLVLGLSIGSKTWSLNKRRVAELGAGGILAKNNWLLVESRHTLCLAQRLETIHRESGLFGCAKIWDCRVGLKTCLALRKLWCAKIWLLLLKCSLWLLIKPKWRFVLSKRRVGSYPCLLLLGLLLKTGNDWLTLIERIITVKSKRICGYGRICLLERVELAHVSVLVVVGAVGLVTPGWPVLIRGWPGLFHWLFE